MTRRQQRILDWSIPEPNSGCWLWTGYLLPNGYARISFDGRSHGAHRASWLAFRGPISDGLCVCHKCDVRSCVNPDHLWLGTKGDNNRDAFQKGRQPIWSGPRPKDSLHWINRPRGERMGFAKLTNQSALAIFHSTGTQREIAARFGVNASTVSLIKSKKK